MERKMTLDEAKAWGEIISRADGGCAICVDNLVDLANERFPDFRFKGRIVDPTEENGWTYVEVDVTAAA